MKNPELAGKRENVRFRGMQLLRAAACLMLAAQLAGYPIATAAGDKPAAVSAASDPVLKAMQTEIARATTELGKAEQPPYYLGYTVYDQEYVVLVGAYGSLLTNAAGQRRFADVNMRVGKPELDNTHGQSRPSGVNSGSLPLGNDGDAIARVLWELTDREYKRAVPSLMNVRTNTAVRAEEEDKSPDFSKEKPQTHIGEVEAVPPFDRTAWEGEIKRLSGVFRKYPEVYYATVMIQVQRTNSRMVSSEGSAIVSPSASTRLIMEAQTRADDGMDLLRVETFQAPAASNLPSEAELTRKIEKMATDLIALRKAPVAEPYDGPAILSGRAAAVFFHEVLGHRLEGHRQRDEEEGQTFTKKIGQEVLPKFLSVTDDPTVHEMGGMKLAGAYEFDNEGEPSRKVEVIKDGVLKNFLMSRMPIKNFEQSNGHGRNQPGRMPTGRQGNLIVTSTQTVPEADMRQTRSLPQAFQVLPVLVYKVYADGRPDELVRGVDIVGTPLAALTRILTTGDQPKVFNGVCGAESGQVPVAAIAPSMLFSEMEVQKRAHEHERPPLLPPPGFEDMGAAKDAAAKTEVKP